jgi:hypothetical protein
VPSAGEFNVTIPAGAENDIVEYKNKIDNK